jgi:acetyl esterase/lipase
MLPLVAALVINPQVFQLYPGTVPGALGTEDKDIPTLTLYRPENPNGTAIVICPGGGYQMLADHEGRDYALWLNRFGITSLVLKYRLASGGYHQPTMIQDVTQAIKFTRFHAPEWSIKRDRIGVMGSSAGGHLASTILTHYSGKSGEGKSFEEQSSRPDFGILCYAVITLGPGTHEGSRDGFLGPNPSPQLIDQFSNEKQVTKDTPPCFIWSTGDDNVVPVTNSLGFAAALSAAKVPYELHIYPHGPHGLGLGGAPTSDALLPWTTELKRWLGEVVAEQK